MSRQYAISGGYVNETDERQYVVAGGFLNETESAADETPPSLSGATGTATGETTATLAVTTDEANGTLYVVVTESATSPTAAQVKAGDDHADADAVFAGSQVVSSTGEKTFNATGLSPETTYYAHFMHEDAASNQSDVATSSSFDTDPESAETSELTITPAAHPGTWTAFNEGSTEWPAQFGTAGADPRKDGLDERPILKWLTPEGVTYETSGKEVWLDARHFNGMEWVKIYCNGELAGTFTGRKKLYWDGDTATGFAGEGYRIKLNTAASDGLVELRAVAKPNTRGRYACLQGEIPSKWYGGATNGIAGATLSGDGTTVTVSATGHGLSAGQSFYIFGTPRAVTFDPDTEIFTCTSGTDLDDVANGTRAIVAGTTRPSPFSASPNYFIRVVDAEAMTFTLHTSAGGAIANTGIVNGTTAGTSVTVSLYEPWFHELKVASVTDANAFTFSHSYTGTGFSPTYTATVIGTPEVHAYKAWSNASGTVANSDKFAVVDNVNGTATGSGHIYTFGVDDPATIAADSSKCYAAASTVIAAASDSANGLTLYAADTGTGFGVFLGNGKSPDRWITCLPLPGSEGRTIDAPNSWCHRTRLKDFTVSSASVTNKTSTHYLGVWFDDCALGSEAYTLTGSTYSVVSITAGGGSGTIVVSGNATTDIVGDSYISLTGTTGGALDGSYTVQNRAYDGTTNTTINVSEAIASSDTVGTVQRQAPTFGSRPVFGPYQFVHVTGCTVKGIQIGYEGPGLLLDTVMDRISEDAVREPGAVLDLRVTRMRSFAGSGAHPDAIQTYGIDGGGERYVQRYRNLDGFIRFGPLFFDRGICLINCLWENCYTTTIYLDIDSHAQHMLVIGCTLHGEHLIIRQTDPNHRNLLFRGTSFKNISRGSQAYAKFESTHDYEGTAAGSDATGVSDASNTDAFINPRFTGDAIQPYDYSPKSTGNLVGAWASPDLLTDIDGNDRGSPATIGAIESAVADETPPEVVSIIANDDTITVTYNESLDETSTPATGDFSHSTKTISGVDVVGNAVLLTVTVAFGFEDAGGTLSYTPDVNPIRDLAENDAAGFTDEPVTNSTPDPSDETPPALSVAIGTTASATTATLAVTTDEGNGTLYVVVTTSATAPSAAQVKAGQNDLGIIAAFEDSQTISASGEKTFNATGLVESTTYYAHFMHEDAATNQSNVASSNSFVTSVPATLVVLRGSAPFASGATHNFGNVLKDAIKTRVFTLKNIGEDTLSFGPITTDGDVSIVDNGPMVAELEQDATFDIEVTLEAATTGSKSGSVEIFSNDEDSPRVLNFVGNVVDELPVSTGQPRLHITIGIRF